VQLNRNIILLFLLSFIYTEEPFSEYKSEKNYYPKKITNNDIYIDGFINEVLWEETISITDFVQAEPLYISKPSEITEVKILYSDDAIFISVYLFQDPNKIKTKNAIYDDWENGFDNNSDYFVVEIDSRHNHQKSYAFAVNSSGVQADYILYNDGLVNDDWNEYWESNVSIQSDGWSIEYKIPLSILQYDKNSLMGINFIRFIQHNKESDYWVLLPIEFDGTVSHYGHIRDLDIPNKKNIYVKPYFIFGETKIKNSYYEFLHDGTLNFEEFVDYNYKYRKNRFGFDFKYIHNNHINFEFAFNPSEGVVEQNPNEINLTLFESYKPEKRPFFTNNISIFYTPIEIFYSKRIGGNIFINEFSYSTLINNALKIYGESNEGLSYGMIISKMDIDENVDFYSKVKSSVIRLRKNIINQNSYIGLMNTSYKDFRYSAYTFSIDGKANLFSNKLKIDGQSVTSNLNGNIDGYGHSYELSYLNKLNSNIDLFNNSIIELWINYEQFSKDFDINNIGYLQRNNMKKINIGVAFTNINPTNYIIEKTFNIQSTYSKNMDEVELINDILLKWDFSFINFWDIEISYLKSLEHYNDWLVGGSNNMLNQDSIVIKQPSSDEVAFFFETSPIEKWSFNSEIKYFNDEIKNYGGKYSLNLIYKPTTSISLDLRYSLDDYKNKYHFLKIRQSIPDPPPPPPPGIITREEHYEKYYFSNSKILEKQIEMLFSMYLDNNINIEIFARYFNYYNSYPNYYYQLENNFEYPNLIEFISDEQKENDILLYSAIFTSLELNYIFKWEFKKRANLYFIYSVFKGISGIKFNDISLFLNHEPDDKTEIFYDQSFLVKLNFLLN